MKNLQLVHTVSLYPFTHLTDNKTGPFFLVTYIVMFNIHARMLCELETVSYCVDESNFFHSHILRMIIIMRKILMFDAYCEFVK